MKVSRIAATKPTKPPKSKLGPSQPGLEFSGVGVGQVLSSALPPPYAARLAKASLAASIKRRVAIRRTS
jgi:hypothetical protein